MRRFGLVLEDDLYNEFYRIFPDHGQRSGLLRRCIKRMITRARENSGVVPTDINEIADGVAKMEEGK